MLNFDLIGRTALRFLPCIVSRWLPDGRRSGREWIARNPRRADRHPGSFRINLATGRWADFATGDSGGDAISLVAFLSGMSQADAARELAQTFGIDVEGGRLVIAALGRRGLWDKNGRCPPRFAGVMSGAAASGRAERGDSRREAAFAIWHSSIPAEGTLVDTYLASRGLHLAPPPTLRFHGGLKHPSGAIWPSMVALVTRGADNTPLAIHRTFLACNGAGKAPIEPAKMMFGPCRGGAVRLADSGDILLVGEGIETCFAAMQATGHSTWAALSTSGLRSLDLPNDVRDVIVLADGDDAGEAAARDCAIRWKRQGRRVRIARPPLGTDFNDLLPGRAHLVSECSG